MMNMMEHNNTLGLMRVESPSRRARKSAVRRNNSHVMIGRRQQHSWMVTMCCILAIVAIQMGSLHAFQPPVPMVSTRTTGISAGTTFADKTSLQRSVQLFAASDGDDESSSAAPSTSKKRRKRKRKQPESSAKSVVTTESAAMLSPPPAPAPAAPVEVKLKPRDDTPVQLEIKNVMRPTETPKARSASAAASMDLSSSSSPTASSSSATSSSDGGGLDDSLAQLLQDAKRMKEESSEGGGGGGLLSDEEGTGIKEIIRNVLSTIVTADFFVVCGFLLWFLAGILWRAAFNDDTVQIAFNNNFETLVQPALGILMIAALAGNFFKEEEDPDVMM